MALLLARASGLHFASLGRTYRRVRRACRRGCRRVVPAFIALLLCFSVTAQQTQAVPILMTTEIPRLPHVGPTAGQIIGEYARIVLRAVGRLFPSIMPTDPDPPPPPASAPGMPRPWEASDPGAGLFSVVNLANGTLFSSLKLFEWPGVTFALFHSAGSPTPTTIGNSWSHSFAHALRASGNRATLYTDDGRTIVFTLQGAPGSAQTGENKLYRLKIAYDPATHLWTVTDAAQMRRIFNSSGVLLSLADASGYTVALSYSNGLLTTISDPVGRTLVLEYTEDSKLEKITAPPLKCYVGNNQFADVPRTYTLQYSASDGTLEHVVSPRPAPDSGNYRTTFAYQGLIYLAEVTDFRAPSDDITDLKTIYTYTSNRVTKVQHPVIWDYLYGGGQNRRAERLYNYDFSQPGVSLRTTVTDEKGGQWRLDFDSGRRLLVQKDPLNRTLATMTWNGNNRLLTVENVLQGLTTFTYDANENPDTITTPRGTINVDFDALNNLTQIQDPVNAYPVTYSYSDPNNPTQVTGIDSDGPGYSNASFQWGAGANAGLLAQTTDPNSVIQQFQYDLSRNPKLTLLGRSGPEEVCTMMPDHKYLSAPTGENIVTQEASSCNDSNFCDPCTQNYDASGNVTSFSAPAGCITSLQICDGCLTQCFTGDQVAYDGNNRLLDTISYAGSPLFHLQYDARGRDKYYQAANGPPATTFTRWREFSDSQGRVRTHEEHTPGYTPSEGQTVWTEFHSDPAGRLSEVWRSSVSSETLMRVLHYEYNDTTFASGTPAIKEYRDGVGRTEYYLDSDGAVHEIAHYRDDGTLLARYTYTRDANARITAVDESRWTGTGANYLNARTEYTYGSGTLTAGDLDVNSGEAIEPLKLHYSWLPEGAMRAGDPNRLVKERRTGDTGMAPYQREYWYDPGGNRVSMRSSIPNTSGPDTVVSITRYNYWYALHDLSETQYPPFTPVGGSLYMDPPGAPVDERQTVGIDYAGLGQNKLVSKQEFQLQQAPQRVRGTHYKYQTLAGNPNHLALSAKDEYLSELSGQTWLTIATGNTGLQYNFREQVTSVVVNKNPSSQYPELPQGQALQYYSYDIFGRRSVRHTAPGEFPPPDANLAYHYDGLSQAVLGRVGDRWVEDTYAYGAFGPAIRTDRNGTGANLEDDKDFYYLFDAMGGTMGLMAFVEGQWQASFQVFDAFGNRINPNPIGLTGAGQYRWRGAEGSETDDGRTPEGEGGLSDFTPPSDEGTGLVFMQARYYDPEVGRFIQPDPLPVTSTSSQGLNRYIYCQNDPINYTDTSGEFAWLAAAAIAVTLLILSYLLRSLLKRYWKQIACRLALSGSLKAITDHGTLGWIGIALEGIGLMTMPVPFAAVITWPVLAVGFVLVQIDNLLTWAFDELIDYILSVRDHDDAEFSPGIRLCLRRKLVAPGPRAFATELLA